MKKLFASVALATLCSGVDARAQVDDFRAITEDMLRNPAPGDWPNWHRTNNAWGYSRLTEITTENVGQLQLAWSWAMDDTGGQEAAPLVHNGVMYLPSSRGVVQALDAANGDLLWEYRPGVSLRADGSPATDNSGLPVGAFAGVGRGVQKNIAIYGSMLYSATGNASIVAVDARTGRQVWETSVADPTMGYTYTAGPIVANGTLVTGITGCDRFKEDICFITGHDPMTGEERWRTSTVARPGEPGARRRDRVGHTNYDVGRSLYCCAGREGKRRLRRGALRMPFRGPARKQQRS